LREANRGAILPSMVIDVFPVGDGEGSLKIHGGGRLSMAVSTGPTPVISLGGTDARLWRYKDLPAIVYGPSPTGMGSTDEHVTA
jgi:hypothetical protein